MSSRLLPKKLLIQILCLKNLILSGMLYTPGYPIHIYGKKSFSCEVHRYLKQSGWTVVDETSQHIRVIKTDPFKKWIRPGWALIGFIWFIPVCFFPTTRLGLTIILSLFGLIGQVAVTLHMLDHD